MKLLGIIHSVVTGVSSLGRLDKAERLNHFFQQMTPSKNSLPQVRNAGKPDPRAGCPQGLLLLLFFPSDIRLAADSTATQISLPLQNTTSCRGPKELIQTEDKEQNSTLEPGFSPLLVRIPVPIQLCTLPALPVNRLFVFQWMEGVCVNLHATDFNYLPNLHQGISPHIVCDITSRASTGMQGLE